MRRQDDDLSLLELRVLLALERLQPNGYGISVVEYVLERTGRTLLTGGVYAAIKKLEARGLVVSTVGEAKPVKGGRAIRFSVPTDAGMSALGAALNELDALRGH